MLFSRSKSKLGIDIGTSSIKVVQLKKEENAFHLETYGIVRNLSYEVSEKKKTDALSETARVLKELLEKSDVDAKKAVASLPNNVVFVTMIEMPVMNDKQLKEAIEWEAKRYVPLPLDEVTLSWSTLPGDPGKDEKKQKVLLTAVPTNVIDNYLKMFKLAGIEPEALEIEALALIRSLVGPKKQNAIIIDIGAKSTTINLVEQGFLRVSRNLSIGGETITNSIAKSLKVSYNRAEQFKRELGMGKELTEHIPQALKPVMDKIKHETTQLINMFESGGGKAGDLILAGSGSQLPGIEKHLSDVAQKVRIGDPLKYIAYPESLKSAIEKKSLSLSVAIGLAMRE